MADPNPYDGITPGQIDLWTKDHYHASAEGYYLEALMAFGDLTGRDPRSLGDGECSAFELGMSVAEVKALQQVAFDQLSVTKEAADEPEPIGSEGAGTVRAVTSVNGKKRRFP